MSGYLLDTNIISEYNRPETPHPGVVKWIQTTPETLQHLSVLTLAEIEMGILLLEEGKRRQEIRRWLEEDFAGEVRWTCSLHRPECGLDLGARFIAPLLK
jgi:predicted nucleic acid-binding protein